MSCPKISIVTVVYNNKNTIEDTLLSVINQCNSNIEYIVIDGDSTDGTKDIIEKYKENIDIYLSEKDNGIYSAMNKGLRLATGDWIFFLNVGDCFYSDSVIQTIPFQDAQESTAFIIGKVMVRLFNGIFPSNFETIPFYLNSSKYKNMGFSHQGVFLKTKLAKELGFDEHYKLCADYNMLVKAVERGYRGIETKVLIAVVEGRDGASQRKAILQFKETAEICQLNKNSLYYRYRLIRAYLGLFKMNLFRTFNQLFKG